jgi:hypothetical protein
VSDCRWPIVEASVANSRRGGAGLFSARQLVLGLLDLR